MYDDKIDTVIENTTRDLLAGLQDDPRFAATEYFSEAQLNLIVTTAVSASVSVLRAFGYLGLE